VQYPQDDDRITPLQMRDDVRQSRDYQFPGTVNTAGPPYSRVLLQEADAVDYIEDDIQGRARVVATYVFLNASQIVTSGARPS
jgi:hypothetical protein